MPFASRENPGLRIGCVAAVILIGCSDPTGTPGARPENTDLSLEWPVVAPAEQGFDETRLATAFIVARSRAHLKSLLVLRRGYLVAEEYFGADDDSTITDVRAVTTSFLSALVGIAIREGHIANVDQSIGDFLVPGAVPDLDAEHRGITIRHLLTMTSGLQWQEGTQAENDGFNASGHSDLWRYALSKPVVQPPGSRINYNSGAASLLSVVLTHATGIGVLEYARQKLLAPLGIDSIAWVKDGAYWYGGSAMRMRARDAAKLGVLYVNGGVSGGRTIVPADWIAQTLTPIVANGVPYYYGPVASMNYGFLWWVDRQPSRDAFFAWGFGGQFVYCVPALKLVIVTTTDASALNYDTKGDVEIALLELIIDRVIPAVVD
jgi:CubicO group peptidase (beta-lactamase class C family)